MKSQSSSTKVSAVGISPIDDDGVEYPETVPVLPMPPPAPLHNKYGPLMEYDDEDLDESDVVTATAAITPNVSLASDHSSQKTRKLNHVQKRSMNVAHLNAIARDVKGGQISPRHGLIY